mgnify:CR=1 FL=1
MNYCFYKQTIAERLKAFVSFKDVWISTVARGFVQVLKRQTSLNHLCQAARTVINSPEITSQMLDDWCNVDLNSIIKQTLYTAELANDTDNTIIVKSKDSSWYENTSCKSIKLTVNINAGDARILYVNSLYIVYLSRIHLRLNTLSRLVSVSCSCTFFSWYTLFKFNCIVLNKL